MLLLLQFMIVSLFMNSRSASEEENRSRQIQEERLHMFGPIDFTDLTERSEDPLVLMKPFKKTVMFALALGRLVIRPLSVDFITKRDLDAGRRDNPSLHLGESIADIYKSFQSTRTEDQNAIKQITEEMKYVKDMVATNDEIKNSLAEKLKASFEELNKNPPAGITPADIDLIDEIAKELCGLELVQKPKDGGLW